MKIANTARENYLRNFNEVFRKDMPYDNIKVTKNHGFTLSLEDTLFTLRGGVN